MIRKSLVLVGAFAVAACTSDVTGWRSSLEGLPDGLEVGFALEPDEVSQHEPFSVQLRVTNTTPDTIRVVTANSCLAIPRVLHNGQPAPFKGSWWGCFAAITTHVFPPSETRSLDWDMKAELYAQHSGDLDGVPAPRGTYVIQVEFDTYRVDGSGPKPAVERTLQVR